MLKMNRVQKTICIRFTGERIIVVIEFLIIKLYNRVMYYLGFVNQVKSLVHLPHKRLIPVLLDGNYLGLSASIK